MISNELYTELAMKIHKRRGFPIPDTPEWYEYLTYIRPLRYENKMYNELTKIFESDTSGILD